MRLPAYYTPRPTRGKYGILTGMETGAAATGNGNAEELLTSLVQGLRARGLIRTPAVERAFLDVPRGLFLPNLPPEQAYADEAIPTKVRDGVAISSSSQPAVMAIMLEQLGLEPGHRVLEIGAGTGYNAALMAHLIGEEGRVVALDIDEDIVEGARAHLDAAGFGRVEVVRGDGAAGYPAAAPYDRIILTVSSSDIAPAWVEQLKPGGRLLLPLSMRGAQQIVAFEERAGRLESVSVRSGGFMPLRGELADARTNVDLDVDLAPGYRLSSSDGRPVDALKVAGWLGDPARDGPAGFEVSPGEIYASLILWLSLHDSATCGLSASGEAADRGIVPCVFLWGGQWRTCSTAGVLSEGGLCVLARPPDRPRPESGVGGADRFELWLRSFGSDDSLEERLSAHIGAWDAAGRPSPEALRIVAYPREAVVQPAGGEVVIENPHSRLVLRWE